MKKQLKELKKGELFIFNGFVHVVKQRFADWRRNGEPYLVTLGGIVFDFDELEVTTVDHIISVQPNL